MSDVGAGAAGGAAIGSAFSPLGTAIGAGIGAIGGGIVDLLGQNSANNLNWQEFVSNQSFDQTEIASAQNYNEMMANTAHQREMADLQKAGLNPILAANGGAPSPTAPVMNPGVGNPIQNPLHGLAGALGQAIPDAMSAANTATAMANTNIDSLYKVAQTYSAQADARNTDMDTLNKGLQTGAIKDEATARSVKAQLEAKYANAQKILDMATQTIGGLSSAVNPVTNLVNTLSQIKQRAAQTQLQGLRGVPTQ